MTSLNTILQGIKKRCEAATEGPWIRCHHLESKEKDKSCPCGFPGDIWGADKEHVVCTMGPHLHVGDEGNLSPPRYDREQEISNGIFIAHARTDVPRLIEALELAVARLEAKCPPYMAEPTNVWWYEHNEKTVKKIEKILSKGVK